MKKSTIQAHRHILGVALIIIAVALLIYDFFSPPVGQLSNFALILFAKLIAIAGALMNINLGSRKSDNDDI
ncbi:MAG: hypothetical protein K2N25_04785 [Muribaculaceae bacterium]|nr:hypothetical protein [Muribaculaceae bacterium]